MRDRPAWIVGVVNSPDDLQRALRLRGPDFLLELRLDALVASLTAIEPVLPKVNVPLIVTARHPLEGGMNRLGARERRALLLRFLEHAAFLDLELRTLRGSKRLIEADRAARVRIIVSFHDLHGTPRKAEFAEKLRFARSCGADILKIATRVDDDRQLERLLAFFEIASRQMPPAAMGLGSLGRAARHELMRRGSVLNYGYLNRSNVEGQPSVAELRRWRGSDG